MNLRTDQQRMLADSAVQFCAGEHGEHRVRACRGRAPDFDREVWRKAAGLGWLGIAVPQADGGLGLGLADLGEVLGPWGSACAPEPLVAAGVLAARAIVHGDGPARARLLESLVAGELIPALSWANPAGEVAPVPAVRRGNEVVLSGEARFVVPADADGWLVYGSEGLAFIKAGTKGISVERERRADGSFAARLRFKNASVHEDGLVAGKEKAKQAVESALDEGRIALALEMAGMMRRMLDLTLEYLRTRVQFGKPIGGFQALQHRAVDLFIACELAEDVARAAARTADSGRGSLALAATRAKARASESLGRIAREAVQLHGAIGFTDEYSLGLYVNRALVHCAWLGGADAMRARYAAIAPAFESEVA